MRIRIVRAVVVAALSALWLATPARASFPGADGRIAFAHRTPNGVEISTMAPDGSDRRMLTRRSISRDPAWSADGARIAFVRSDAGAPQELLSMSAEGADVRRLSRDVRLEAWPAWSPDGRRIALVTEGRRREYEIATVRADGGGWRRLTRHSGSSDPDWSPDGSRIAFDVDGSIATMGPHGHRIHVLTTGFEPTWAPGGLRIAFADGGDLWTIRPDGSGRVRLTSTGIDESSPAWSPSGRRIAYLRTRSNDEASRYLAAIWTIRPDGTDATRLIRRVSEDQLPLEAPAWQPRPAG